MPQANQPLAIVTGASSGVGLHTTNALIGRGWHVIMACRDIAKAEAAARSLNMASGSFEIAHIDLGSLDSVRAFHAAFRARNRPLDALVCNAAVYLPLLKAPARSPEGYEISVATNYFGHFLLANLMLADLQKSAAPRLITLGTVTANSEEFGGNHRHPALPEAGAKARKNSGGRSRQNDLAQTCAQGTVSERCGQLDQVRIDGPDSRIGREVIDPEHADGNDEGGRGFADAEPDDRKRDPGERRDRAQQAREPALDSIHRGKQRDGGACQHTQK